MKMINYITFSGTELNIEIKYYLKNILQANRQGLYVIIDEIIGILV